MRRLFAFGLAAFLSLVAPAAASPPPASSFSAHVANPWFPLLPGTR
jgi:hypothetical protein